MSEPTPQPETPTENVGTRLLFENERVRVWDLALAPGESLPAHVHRLPFCFIVAHGGNLRHADPGAPHDGHEVTYAANQVEFRDVTGEAVHLRLTNIGDAPYQNYVIEFKPQP